MILSASRRTDIPNYYSDWFFNRLQEGFLFVRNPYNPHQISRIDLSPETVDCIVFWTKNPEPILGRLEELEGYPYYFQFTLTGYGKDIEPNVPHKKEKMLSVFRELSGRIGSRRVIWRYDPILFTKKYSTAYHLRAFEQIAGCAESVEIGTYDTCQNSCLYCYASHSRERLLQNIRCYDPCSPLLCGKVTEEDRVSVRKASSIRETQFSLTFSKNI